MTDASQLTLSIPDLLTAARGQKLPALTILLGRANKIVNSFLSYEQALGQLFNYPSTVPVAALTAMADGLPVLPKEWWLRIDPVELSADQATVYLLGTEHLRLSSEETNRLVRSINDFLQQDGLQLLAPHPYRWYVRLLDEPQLETMPPQTLIGKPITQYLSIGAAYWRRLFSELQILLYSHAVNELRQQANKPTINGVWFWGGGCLPASSPSPEWQKVYCNEALGIGFAQWNKIPVADIPESFAVGVASERTLIMLPSFDHEQIMQWEELWFQPLLTALKNKHISEITLATQQQSFTVSSKDIKKWWRRGYSN